MTKQLPLASLLYQALDTEVGILVATNSPDKLRQKLYPIRKDNPDFARLGFKVSPQNPESELWIVKQPEGSTDE